MTVIISGCALYRVKEAAAREARTMNIYYKKMFLFDAIDIRLQPTERSDSRAMDKKDQVGPQN